MSVRMTDAKITISNVKEPDIYHLCQIYGVKYISQVLSNAIVAYVTGKAYQHPNLPASPMKTEGSNKNVVLRVAFRNDIFSTHTISELLESNGKYGSTSEICKALIRAYTFYEAVSDYRIKGAKSMPSLDVIPLSSSTATAYSPKSEISELPEKEKPISEENHNSVQNVSDSLSSQKEEASLTQELPIEENVYGLDSLESLLKRDKNLHSDIATGSMAQKQKGLALHALFHSGE